MKIHRPSASFVAVLFLVFLVKPVHGTHLEINPQHTSKETRISLQFSEIELTELLQVLAKMGNSNFLLSESIQGKISVDLKDTPWQTALHSIIASRGLRLVRNGDIYWIGPQQKFKASRNFAGRMPPCPLAEII